MQVTHDWGTVKIAMTMICFLVLCILLPTRHFVLSFIPRGKASSQRSAVILANNHNGNMGFKRSPGNIGIPQKNTLPQDVKKDDNLRAEARRRKVGPPNRGGNNNLKREESLAAGRVSVYCLGAGLDLQTLRAHVFRRGFGSQSVDVGTIVEVRRMQLTLMKSIRDTSRLTPVAFPSLFLI